MMSPRCSFIALFVVIISTSNAFATCDEDVVPSWAVPVDATFQYQLAERLWSGDDCYIKDMSRGMELYQLSAEKGYAPAQNRIGRFHEFGFFGREDKVEAARWYRLAAVQGYARGQVGLAGMYRFGNGVLQDYKEAARWYRLAAKQGNTTGQFSLGYMHRAGQGVLQDKVLAHMWFNIASANGDTYSATQRDELALTMASEEIIMAQSLARKCLSSNYQQCGY